MSELLSNLTRDISFIERDQLPLEVSGLRVEKLDYQGEDEAKLNDDDVYRLSEALKKNNCFRGPLDLSKNDLTDLSALYLKESLGEPGKTNITKLNLSNNPGLKFKSGIFIGDALVSNPDQPVRKVSFKNCNMKEDGLIRILEACNKNKNIKSLHAGYVSNKGLKALAQVLAQNDSLQKLKFQEDSNSKWQDNSKAEFIQLLQQNKCLQKVKFEACDKKDDTQGHYLFKKEVDFFIKKITALHKSNSEFEQRIESCSNNYMVEQMLKLIEDKDEHKKMPVRKFFNNTFSTLLNDAIFQLTKKQMKSKSTGIMTMQGSIRFVANYLLDHLPEAEQNAESDEDVEETDEVN